MNVILDDIIWSLQQFGGISVYWNQLTGRLLQNENIKLSSIELKKTKKVKKDAFRNKRVDRIKAKQSLSLPERYSNLKYTFNEKHIFHSSYYRYSYNPKAINVTTVHDFTYETHSKGLKKWVHVFQKKKALEASQGIVCISDYSRDLMYELYPFTKKKKVKVIHNGLSELILDHSTVDINADLPFKEKTYALYIGNREAAYKNFSLSVDIINQLQIPLVIVGGGKLTEEEQEKLNSIRFKQFSFVEDSTLYDLYKGAKFLLYPSESEGFGIPIIEAQTLNCPVVTTNKTCIPEISGGACVMINDVTVENFISGINKLESISFRTNLLKKGRENAKKYSWQRNFEETLNFYNELLLNN